MMTSGSRSSGWSAGDEIGFGAVAGGATGLIYGAVIGAFVHERPVVYRATVPTVGVSPVLGAGRCGVMLSVQF
jgi:hypothetical protein